MRGQRGGRRVAHAAGGVLGRADMDLAGQEGAGGQHHGLGVETQAGLGDDPAHGVTLDHQIVYCGLEHGQVGLAFDNGADRHAVQVAVGLAAGGTHGRTLGGVERAPLDAGAVGGMRHRTAKGVDFLDQVALADAADGRVAAHRAHRLDVVGQQQGAHAGAGRGQRGFGASVATADDDDVVTMEGRVHGCCSAGCGRGRGRRRGGDFSAIPGRDVVARRLASKSALKLAGFLQITQ